VCDVSGLVVLSCYCFMLTSPVLVSLVMWHCCVLHCGCVVVGSDGGSDGEGGGDGGRGSDGGGGRGNDGGRGNGGAGPLLLTVGTCRLGVGGSCWPCALTIRWWGLLFLWALIAVRGSCGC
jgi:hypothetical protein